MAVAAQKSSKRNGINDKKGPNRRNTSYTSTAYSTYCLGISKSSEESGKHNGEMVVPWLISFALVSLLRTNNDDLQSLDSMMSASELFESLVDKFDSSSFGWLSFEQSS